MGLAAGRGADKNNTPEMKGGQKENRYYLFPSLLSFVSFFLVSSTSPSQEKNSSLEAEFLLRNI